MKKKKILKIGLSLAAVALLSVAVVYAFANKANENPKSKPENVTASLTSDAVQESEKHPHAEGSAECIEKHAKGECQGHEPGQPHMEKGDNPGHGHEEGECKGHQPGDKHSENHGKSQE